MMTMKRARRLHPSGAASFRSWVRDLWKKFGEISSETQVSGKLVRILGAEATVREPAPRPARPAPRGRNKRAA